MSRSRHLTEAEIEIWLKVVQTVLPRPGAAAPSLMPPAEPVSPTPAPKPEPKRRPTAASYSPPVSTPGTPPPAGFERRFKKKVAGGRVDIDAALDLHGMTQAEAHAALLGFLAAAQARGARLVLVVTGKGSLGRRRLGNTGETGVLRRVVPHWLRDLSLRNIVMSFEEAAQPHGGAGALYIRLRRRSARL